VKREKTGKEERSWWVCELVRVLLCVIEENSICRLPAPAGGRALGGVRAAFHFRAIRGFARALRTHEIAVGRGGLQDSVKARSGAGD
jgi:hypothetical protein